MSSPTTRYLPSPKRHVFLRQIITLLILLAALTAFAGRVSADEDPPVFLSELGSYGAAKELFRAPNDVAVDSDGYIYVADTYNHRVQVFNGTDWITIGGDGEIGTAAGEFNQPRGVAVASDGTVYVADRQNHRVQMFDGEEWTVIGGDGEIGADPGEFYFPMGLVL
jgi:tripartite motif-containing protein 71